MAYSLDELQSREREENIVLKFINTLAQKMGVTDYEIKHDTSQLSHFFRVRSADPCFKSLVYSFFQSEKGKMNEAFAGDTGRPVEFKYNYTKINRQRERIETGTSALEHDGALAGSLQALTPVRYYAGTQNEGNNLVRDEQGYRLQVLPLANIFHGTLVIGLDLIADDKLEGVLLRQFQKEGCAFRPGRATGLHVEGQTALKATAALITADAKTFGEIAARKLAPIRPAPGKG